ncbi:hypothetical protein SECTIM467_104 [Brevibacillus phage SecTim467]|uniref:Uncharacterized protein n=2 Tax=Jenstvirus jenst TaxID=1982225 RepID=A0A0K2CPR6_9CAUD|nr:hypothetical protein AVV11_gp092 [Brevibacillus phage Jenst]ALA07228.1 hypothetical protein JENST_99 [Brevibacillus phage Jenst]ALA07579.1 hypothetical protein SECTIM467_104 [Brevibacillus phage SecTim467]
MKQFNSFIGGFTPVGGIASPFGGIIVIDPEGGITSSNPLSASDGLSLIGLIAKAKEAERLVEENAKLREEIKVLGDKLSDAISSEDFEYAPLFPEDFEYCGGEPVSDDEIQDIVIEAAEFDLQEGEFHYASTGNAAVIRMHDGDKIVTVVAKDFFEHIEDVEAECAFPDCDCSEEGAVYIALAGLGDPRLHCRQ